MLFQTALKNKYKLKGVYTVVIGMGVLFVIVELLYRE
jgi:hypothetical protein